MKFTIFNVEHGFFGYLISDTNNVMVFDCGHNQSTSLKPSLYLPQSGCSGIEYFILSNYDQDHFSDLPNLVANIPITLFYRNKSISIEQLKRLKLESGPLTYAANEMLRVCDRFSAPVYSYPSLGNLEFNIFHNNYPTFSDTNNLSLVTFIKYRELCIVYPGDLEKDGWEKLLEDNNFTNELSKVNLFIASHHGRVNGYCESVFDFCHPEIFIISDSSIKYDTQKHDYYSKHSTGVNFPNGKRYVLTTRNDGNITIEQTILNGATITCQNS